MSGRFRWALIFGALAAAASIASCTGLSAAGRDDTARLRQQAQAALTRWDAALAAGGPAAFVFVGDLTGQVGDWEEATGNNNKPALMAGMVEAAIPLPSDTPPGGQLRRQDGTIETVRLISAQQARTDLKADAAASSGSCSECVPLQITAARLTTGPVETNRGPAEAPAWEFTVKGTAVLVTRVAIAGGVQVAPPIPDPNGSAIGIWIDSATASTDGRQITVSFTGSPDAGDKACGADYTAEAVESQSAAVIFVIEHRNGLPVACTAVGARRTAVADLSAPLGNRTVLDVVRGLPVAWVRSR